MDNIKIAPVVHEKKPRINAIGRKIENPTKELYSIIVIKNLRSASLSHCIRHPKKSVST